MMQQRFKGAGVGLVLLGAVLGVSLGAGRGPLKPYKSRSYQIESDLDSATVKRIGKHMDMVFAAYTRRFRDYPIRNAKNLKLWIFQKEDTYQEFLKDKGLNGAGSGGMFFVSGEGSGLAAFIGQRSEESVLETLRHEGLHQFAYTRIHESLPQWVNEGMGEYFGYAIETKHSIEPGVVDRWVLARIQTAIKKNQTYPLSELLFMTNAEWNGRVTSGDARAGVMYDQSWSVVHFLMHGEGGKYEHLLWDYLRAAWQGLNTKQASDRVFSGDLEPMETAWRAYVESLRIDPLLETREKLEVFEFVLRQLHKQDIYPKSLEEMQAVLQERKFQGKWTRGETELPITGDPKGPGGWWMKFPQSLKGRPSKMRFIPFRGKKIPPIVEVRDLRQKIKLTWKVSRGGGEPEAMYIIGL